MIHARRFAINSPPKRRLNKQIRIADRCKFTMAPGGDAAIRIARGAAATVSIPARGRFLPLIEASVRQSPMFPLNRRISWHVAWSYLSSDSVPRRHRDASLSAARGGSAQWGGQYRARVRVASRGGAGRSRDGMRLWPMCVFRQAGLGWPPSVRPPGGTRSTAMLLRLRVTRAYMFSSTHVTRDRLAPSYCDSHASSSK